jgi:hypothetical protein
MTKKEELAMYLERYKQKEKAFNLAKQDLLAEEKAFMAWLEIQFNLAGRQNVHLCEMLSLALEKFND